MPTPSRIKRFSKRYLHAAFGLLLMALGAFAEAEAGPHRVGWTPDTGSDSRRSRAVAAPMVAGPVINEFSASTVGTDVEYVEVRGPAGSDGSSWTVIAVEGDANANPGTVDAALATGTIDDRGLLLLALPADTLENGTLTLLLVDRFQGAVRDDLDPDDDGDLDSEPWAAVLDQIAVTDGEPGDRTYADTVLGPNFDGLSRFPPGGASRIPDGIDTGAAADWLRNDFDLSGIEGHEGAPDLGEAVNTPGEPNAAYQPSDPEPSACASAPAVSRISTVQGPGSVAACSGSVVVEAVVVGDFEGPFPALGGFYLQEEDAEHDGDPATSEGLFVSNGGRDDVAPGDHVRVEGEAREVLGQTEIRATDVAVLGRGSVTPAAIELPLASLAALEAFEGMHVVLPQALSVTEHYLLGRYGQLTLAAGGRLRQPTDVLRPGAEALALQARNDLSRLIIDDVWLDEDHDPIAFGRNGQPLSPDDPLRGGDTVTGLGGVLTYTPAVPSGGATFRLRVASAAIEAENPRPETPPDPGGSLRVAGFNAQNYFLTLDEGRSDTCGPDGHRQACRGAVSAEAFSRQRTKLLAALRGLDADILGLVELENSTGVEPLADLAKGLDAAFGSGSFAYVDTGTIGTDAIKVGLLYRPARVRPIGPFAVLTTAVDARFLDTKNRPPLAQTFEAVDGSGRVTVVVNHLKSKGSACNDVGDPDAMDGQGNCNGTRSNAAAALVDWLAGDPTGVGQGRTLVLGDINAYTMEDPMEVLRSAGYVDLGARFNRDAASSYVFDGQWGALDHALASPRLAPAVTGAAIWRINADEPSVLGAASDGRSEAQAAALFRPSAYRSSDHDPIIVGFDLERAADGPERPWRVHIPNAAAGAERR